MDELIAKMRSQRANSTQSAVQPDKVKIDPKTSKEVNEDKRCKLNECLIESDNESIQIINSNKNNEKGNFNEIKDEITTSQCEILKFKLDFDLLKKNRKLEPLRISEVKESDFNKIDGPLWAIIKSIETFKGNNSNVFKWELCDETGVIFGSSIVGSSIGGFKDEISIGSIVKLTNFSIWKTNGNHLNIVERNIAKVI
jgi:hypothetical protein